MSSLAAARSPLLWRGHLARQVAQPRTRWGTLPFSTKGDDAEGSKKEAPPPAEDKEADASGGSPRGTPPKSALGFVFSLSRPIEAMILRSRITGDSDLARLLAKTASATVYTFGGITLLGTIGVDTKPLIAGIGVTGFAAGFALKEIATNFLCGLLLVFNKPFRKGQYLKIVSAGGNIEGTVEAIDARYVLLRTARDAAGSSALLMVPSVVVYNGSLLVSDKAPAPPK